MRLWNGGKNRQSTEDSQDSKNKIYYGCLGWEWVEGLTSLVKELVVVTKQTEFVKIHRL